MSRTKTVRTEPIGTVPTRRFIADHHGHVHLPREDIFAFVANPNAPSETHVLVSEPCERLAIVGVSSNSDSTMTEAHFDALLDATTVEAKACYIAPPYAVTFASRQGVYSFNHDGKRHRKVA